MLNILLLTVLHYLFYLIQLIINLNFKLISTYIDEQITEHHDYTNQEINALGTEGYIQVALTQALAWITSGEGKCFRKKVLDRISSKWASLTGARLNTEF